MSNHAKETKDLIRGYLQEDRYGVTFRELVEDLSPVANREVLTSALAELVNADEVRYSHNRVTSYDEEDRQSYLVLRYFAAENFLQTPVDCDTIDGVLSFISHSVGITKPAGAVEKDGIGLVYTYFMGQLPPYCVDYALNVLRAEELIVFNVDSKTGYAWLTVSSSQWYTVVTRDIRDNSARWFHVRAGSQQVAINKVMTAPQDAVLELQGVMPGWVEMEPAGAKPGIKVERI